MNQLINLESRRIHRKYVGSAHRTGIPALVAIADRDAKVNRAIERATARWHAEAEASGRTLEEVRDAGDAGRFLDEELRREGL